MKGKDDQYWSIKMFGIQTIVSEGMEVCFVPTYPERNYNPIMAMGFFGNFYLSAEQH